MKYKPDPVCPHCGMSYEDFRCGYDFQSIVELMWKDEKPWPQKHRGGRLGKLREVKVNMWEIHTGECCCDHSHYVECDYNDLAPMGIW